MSFVKCKICNAILKDNIFALRDELVVHNPQAINFSPEEVGEQFVDADRDTIIEKIEKSYDDSEPDALMGELMWLVSCFTDEDLEVMFADRILNA